MDGVGGPLSSFPSKCDMSTLQTTLPASVVNNQVFTDDVAITCTSCTSGANKDVLVTKHFLDKFETDKKVTHALIRNSLHCQQNLRMSECNDVGVVSAAGNQMVSSWKTFDNIAMNFWPGGPRAGGCKCYLSQQCAVTSKLNLCSLLTDRTSHCGT